MGGGRSVEGDSKLGDSKMGDSKGDVTEGNGSPGGEPIEGGSLGGGGNVAAPVGESTPSQVGLGVGGHFMWKGCRKWEYDSGQCR
jgi:hypothetical protein